VLSHLQQRLWFLEQLSPGTASYNVPNAIRIRGSLREDLFATCLKEMFQRHEVLRTTVSSPSGSPVPQVTSTWDSVEIRDFEDHEHPEKDALEFLTQAARKPFNLAHDVPLRVFIARLAAQDHLVLFSAHHIAWDGSSLQILYRELKSLYEALCAGHEAALPPLPIQYGDFAHWHNQRLEGPLADTLQSYWKQQLEGSPLVLQLPTDKPRPLIQQFYGRKRIFDLDSGLIAAARALSVSSKTTLYVTLLASFTAFLHAITGQDDLLIATPFSGRDHPDTEGIIGFFINTVVIRSRLEEQLSMEGLLQNVRRTVLAANEHQSMPFEKIVEIVRPPRDLSRLPVTQVNFRLKDDAPPALTLHGLSIEALPLIDVGISKFDLAFEISAAPGLSGYVEYGTSLFTEGTIIRLCEEYQRILGELLQSPAVSVASLPSFQAMRAAVGRQTRKPLIPRRASV